MATIKEIAELAGVSRGTVDRVLNHRGFVNAETEKKVLEIANLLNYQPNKAGMALAAQKKKYLIGILRGSCSHWIGWSAAQPGQAAPAPRRRRRG